MQIACPKCKTDIPVPAEVTQKGVSRVKCERCEFSFIIRLGEPAQPKPPASDKPKEPLKGVKASGAATSFSGEIGSRKTKFREQESQTSIKIDPTLQEECLQETEKYEQLQIESTKVSTSDPTERDLSSESPANMDTSPIFTPPVMEEPGEPVAEAHAAAAEEPKGIARVSSDKHTAPAGIALPDLPENLLQPVPGAPTSAFPSSKATRDAQVAAVPQGIQVPAVGAGGGSPEGQETYAPSAANAASLSAVGPAGSGITEMIYNPDGTFAVFSSGEPFGEGEDPWEGMLEPTGGSKNLTALGVGITVLLVLSTLLFFFVLYQNNWSLDLANFSGMIDRAFGRAASQQVDQLRQGLEITPPIVEEAKLASGERVVIAKGAIKNRDTRPRKFVYVRALLKDNHGRTVVSDEAPAGNMFTEEQLARLAKSKLMSSMNPAGRDGSNAKLEPGASIGFMVVITDVPPSYSTSKFKVSVEISQVEFFEEP